MEKEVGKITHWYDKIGVAVLDLSATLKAGDRVKVKKGEEEFEETISSMQVDHKEVSSAKKGDEVAVKLSQKAKEGAVIYKVE
ncbi:hypothetical protein A2926_00435 [Candidatus Giovannonibacteria bacterium RIFCSPLOWO2_01_FULL_44_40]|uniref:Translation elongation factor-like protein n=1 Tax=Candidatus Giovannonibacteria bacterium RIFCSPHIGHO2_01_FULL_45_23 TaxID=1798325 RepID=A0A1F5VEQ9_9BACT|nr:MAG: hypothetical protein A2834_00450 [Candidatus Giovannonibacteria bacterium RIFCSPHIGHO2_01_FULL_45_23]OGF76516.1 MAG: hypothetical protein A3C77_03155 [Candidatus Giovannonibacteria bacterium RIFCSPHIGHO2_02_FULL_45_13]OGF79782.1 MAG: hypothetical protein A2926_00435 [Candidatus Giovannonibacteria bacterium RIFCSPLOWO2_01_FULL_44_40]